MSLELLKYREEKLTKKLLKNNPELIKKFLEFYESYNFDRKPDINTFFELNFKYQVAIWLDFLESLNVYLNSYGDYMVLVLRTDDPIIKQDFGHLLKDDGVLVGIAEGGTITDKLEAAIAKLIVYYSLPF